MSAGLCFSIVWVCLIMFVRAKIRVVKKKSQEEILKASTSQFYYSKIIDSVVLIIFCDT